MSGTPKPPAHLSAESKLFWRETVGEYELEGSALRILRLACEAWDTCQQARRALAKAKSLTFLDRFGMPKARPEIAVERDARIGFARLIRELALDVEPPSESRPPSGARYS